MTEKASKGRGTTRFWRRMMRHKANLISKVFLVELVNKNSSPSKTLSRLRYDGR
jgi:hypothetical protein